MTALLNLHEREILHSDISYKGIYFESSYPINEANISQLVGVLERLTAAVFYRV